MGNYIKLDRKILEWEWWSDINTYRLFSYMLLKANWKESSFKGVDVPRGSFVSSIAKLSEGTNLTVDEVRTALKHLKSTNEITSKPHSKFTVFTVNNYCSYQDIPEQITEQNPSSSQTDTKQSPSSSHPVPILFPTIEEEKEIKEGKKGRKEEGKKNENTSYSCTEPVELSAVPEVISIILNDGSRYHVYQKDVDEWMELYPAVDVVQELRKMKGWSDANPTKRKTKKGIKRFINNWLSKEQDKGGVKNNANHEPEKSTGNKNSQFSQFQKHEYDYNSLEEELLSN